MIITSQLTWFKAGSYPPACSIPEPGAHMSHWRFLVMSTSQPEERRAEIMCFTIGICLILSTQFLSHEVFMLRGCPAPVALARTPGLSSAPRRSG